MVSGREKGTFKGILSSPFCVNDRKIKGQTRNKYNMHVFFKDVLFLDNFCSSSKWTGVDRKRGALVENCQKCAEILYG